MTTSTSTAQQGMSTRQLGSALLAAVALAAVLVIALALSQAGAQKAQTAPAAGAAQTFIDHGSRDEIGTWAAPVAPAFIDRGSRDDISTRPATSDFGMHLRGSQATDVVLPESLRPQAQ